MIVMKFGGTSVQDAAAINQVVEIVSARLDSRPVVVVSAMAGVTDALLRITRLAKNRQFERASCVINELRERHFAVAREILREGDDSSIFLPNSVENQIEWLFDELEQLARAVASLGELTLRSQDAIVSLGERLSSLLVVAAFAAQSTPVALVDARRLIITDDNFSNAEPCAPATEASVRARLLPLIEAGRLIVTQGFIGATSEGAPTTLGRGGSDYSAAIIGAALGAEAIEIWTDVDGMMTADPRIVPGARRLAELSFDEAAELARMGAKVLHPKTMLPAVERDIPVQIYNTHNPSSPGTRILARSQPSSCPIKSIALKRNVVAIKVAAAREQSPGGFLSAILEVIEKHRLPIDVMTISATAASLAGANMPNLDAIARDLRNVGEVTLESDKAMICVVGDELKLFPQAPARLMASLDDIGLSLVTQGASQISLVFVIEECESERAVRSLHNQFFAEEESGERSIGVFRKTWSIGTHDQHILALQ
jgi:aspartate kinase